MVRIRRALKILQMARDARGHCKVVVVINMAVRALPGRHRMHASQRETCGVVIEGGIQP